MKNTLFLYASIFLILNVSCSGQKPYMIGNAKWYFEIPEGFIDRTDKFEETIKKGAEEIEERGGTILETEYIISSGKTADSEMNIFLVTTDTNKTIKQLGLEQRALQYKSMFEQYWKEIGSNCKVKFEKVIVDDIPFYSIENIFYDQNDKFIYGSMIYIGEVSDKEFGFTLTYDNDNDRKIITSAFLESRFD